YVTSKGSVSFLVGVLGHLHCILS
nr:hypothetical protein [Tanacetum cinerariifolium]